jgi:hypothetical protein
LAEQVRTKHFRAASCESDFSHGEPQITDSDVDEPLRGYSSADHPVCVKLIFSIERKGISIGMIRRR